MVKPYLDISSPPGSPCREYSLHGLTRDHIIVIYYAVKSYGQVADMDVDALVAKLESLTPPEMEMLVDGTAFRAASRELVKIIHEME